MNSKYENAFFYLAITNFILFLSFVIAFSEAFKNKQENDKHQIAQVYDFIAIVQSNDHGNFEDINLLSVKHSNKLDIIEASLDPSNTRWAKIKQVREVVKKVVEDSKYPKYLSSPELTTYASAVVDYSEEFDVPIPLILAMTQQESAFNPNAISSANAQGMIQIIPSTAREIAGDLGVRHYSMYKIKDNVKFGTYYIMKLLDEFDGDKELAVRAYNCGPTCVYKVLSGEWSVYPLETQNYVSKILGSAEFCSLDKICNLNEGYIHYYERMGL